MLGGFRSQKRASVDDTLDIMDFQIPRCIFPEPDNKSFHLAIPEWNDHPATGFHRFIQLVHKGPNKRQTHRDVGVHGN